MSTYQKDWFAPQKHGERNHYPNKKYSNNGKISEINNKYARNNESKKRLSPAPDSLDGAAPAINDVQCPTFTNITKEINDKKEDQSTKYAGSGGVSILNMYKMQNASRLYNSSYSNNNNANNNNNNNNNSHNPANKIQKSSLDSASTKTGDTAVNGSKKTASHENGHYYPQHSHNVHYNNNHSSQRKKFFAKNSNKSGNLPPSTSVQQNNTKQPTSKHASTSTAATSADTIDFTTSEFFPALSEAMAQTKKQASPPMADKIPTPVVSATAGQTSQKTSPTKAKSSQQTYSKEFLYYVGMQMANRLVNPPPIQARTVASNLLHSASNLLAQASNYNLQTEVTKSLLLEQAMEKTVVAAAAAAAANKEAFNNYASFNYLLPHIHDRDYDAYENSLKGQRMISKQQEDCFYQNNYHFQHAGSSYNMHYSGNNNNNRVGYQNNHSKKQYSYNGNYSGNSKNKGPSSSYGQNNNNSKCPNHNTQNRQANGIHSHENHNNGHGGQTNRNIIYVRGEHNNSNYHNSHNSHQNNHHNRNSHSPTPSAKSESPPIASAKQLKASSPTMTASSMSSGSNQSCDSLRKSNNHSPALSSSSINSHGSSEFSTTVTIGEKIKDVATLTADGPMGKKKQAPDSDRRNQRNCVSDSDSSHSSGSTKHMHYTKVTSHQRVYNADKPDGNYALTQLERQKHVLPSCCQESLYQQNVSAFPFDLLMIQSDDNLRTTHAQYQPVQSLNCWNFNLGQAQVNNYVYDNNGTVDSGLAYTSLNEVTVAQHNNYGQQPKRKLTGRPGNGSSDSVTHNNNYNNFTPPDRFLARSHLVESKDVPEQLLNDSKWDSISAAIWEKFTAAQQSEDTYKKKMYLWRHLYINIKKTFPKFGLYLVGSTISGFGADSSDIDMCLVSRTSMFNNSMDPRLEAVLNLTNLKQFLMTVTGNFEHFNLIEAKVPILRFRDKRNKLEVDLNYNNCVGVLNTHLLHCYAQMDWRVRPLVLTVKLWAQHHQINNAKNSTISSYSLVLMVIHFLQCGVSPPILPCLHTLYPDKFQKPHDIGSIDMNEMLEPFNSGNHQTLGELLMQFLEYYANFDYAQYAISIRTASLLPIDECRMVKSYKNDPRHWRQLCIEEPFDLTNTARSVYDSEIFERIKEIFMVSWKILDKTNNLNALFSSLLVNIPPPSFLPTSMSSSSSLFASLSSSTLGSTHTTPTNSKLVATQSL